MTGRMEIQAPTSGSPVAGRLGFLFLLYSLQQMPLAFTGMAVPILLRQQGASMTAIGMLGILSLPWILKLLYASWIDRWHPPGWGRRRGWILPLQAGSCLCLLVMAAMPPGTGGLAWLIPLFFLNLCTATADVAVDGYATDIMPEGRRAAANAVQIAAASAGFILGGGILLMGLEGWGWAPVMLTLAAVAASTAAVVFWHREIEVIRPASDPRPSAWRVLRCPAAWRVWFTLMLMVGCAVPPFFLRQPFLVDAGFDAARQGGWLIWAGQPACLLAGLLTGKLLSTRWRPHMPLLLGAVSCVLCAAWAVLAALPAFPGWGGPFLYAGTFVLYGLFGTLGYHLIMRASVGAGSATRYATLTSLMMIGGFLLQPLIGLAADRLGQAAVLGGLAATAPLLAYAAWRRAGATEAAIQELNRAASGI